MLSRIPQLILFTSFISLLYLPPLIAQSEEESSAIPEFEEGKTTEVILEFDPYYSDVGVFIPLTSAAIPTITSDSETEIYSKLIKGSAIPRYMLLEASIYPMPILGSYLKKNEPGFYKEWEIGKGGSNFLESITAGFQEPWAVSLFFGNIAKLERPGEPLTGKSWGFTGYLVSAGSKHIKDNIFIADNWYELEWKIKGKRDFPNDKLIWSFRVGGKFHDNPDITNVAYVSIHRSNLNSDLPFLSWIQNAELDFKIHVSQLDGSLTRGEAVVGKKYPISSKNYTPTLNLGLIWSSAKEYSGQLAGSNKNTLTLVFRPSIEF